MKKSDQSLLDYLTEAVGCACISDLRDLGDANKHKLMQVLDKVQLKDFTLFQWNDALVYLTCERAQDTVEMAFELLCQQFKTYSSKREPNE